MYSLVFCVATGSQKKTRELEDDLGGLLTGILERMKDHSIKPNIMKISIMLLEISWAF